MKIVILGAGEMGSYVASALSQEEHDITLIDKDPKVLEQVNREIDVATLLATAPSLSIFQTLMEQKPDLLVAATNDDETNLVSCALAKNLGFPKTVSLIRSPEYLHTSIVHLPRLFYVDHFIGAEMLSARNLFKLLMHSNDIAFEHFAHGAVVMRTILLSEQWTQSGTPIHSLPIPEELIICLIRRRSNGEDIIIIPHGDDYLLPNDEVTLIGQANVMNMLPDLFDTSERCVKSIILVGGTYTSLYLAQLLLQQKVAVRIVEKDPYRCRELADILPDATIINRSILDPQVFLEEDVAGADAFACCTADDGANFLIASLAHLEGCPKIIALANHPAFVPILENAGIIAATSARVNVANRLLSILHQETILSVTSLSNDAAKIVELKISPASKLIGIPLSKLGEQLPKDLLIAVIENHGRVMIGSGSSILCPDDTVIVVCSSQQIEPLQSLFSAHG